MLRSALHIVNASDCNQGENDGPEIGLNEYCRIEREAVGR